EDAVGRHRGPHVYRVDERLAIDAVRDDSSEIRMLQPSMPRVPRCCRGEIDPEQIAVEAHAEIRQRDAAPVDRALQPAEVRRANLALREVDRARLERERFGFLIRYHVEHD